MIGAGLDGFEPQLEGLSRGFGDYTLDKAISTLTRAKLVRPIDPSDERLSDFEIRESATEAVYLGTNRDFIVRPADAIIIEARTHGIARVWFDFRENDFSKYLKMQAQLIFCFSTKYGEPVQTENDENLPVFTWAFDAGYVSLSSLHGRVVIVFTSEADEARILGERAKLALDHAQNVKRHLANRAVRRGRLKHLVVYWVLVPLVLLVIVQFLLVFTGHGP